MTANSKFGSFDHQKLIRSRGTRDETIVSKEFEFAFRVKLVVSVTLSIFSIGIITRVRSMQ